MRVTEVSMKQRQNERAEETRDPRENPPTSASSDTILTCKNPGGSQPGIEHDVRISRDGTVGLAAALRMIRLSSTSVTSVVQLTEPEHCPCIGTCKIRVIRGIKLDFTVLYTLWPPSFLQWLLPGCKIIRISNDIVNTKPYSMPRRGKQAASCEVFERGRIWSSAYRSPNCVFIGCCPTPGSNGIRKVFPCKSAIGSEACRAGQITGDPIAKATSLYMHIIDNITTEQISTQSRNSTEVLLAWACPFTDWPREALGSRPVSDWLLYAPEWGEPMHTRYFFPWFLLCVRHPESDVELIVPRQWRQSARPVAFFQKRGDIRYWDGTVKDPGARFLLHASSADVKHYWAAAFQSITPRVKYVCPALTTPTSSITTTCGPLRRDDCSDLRVCVGELVCSEEWGCSAGLWAGCLSDKTFGTMEIDTLNKLVSLYRLVYKFADVNCALLVCCHSGRRRLAQPSPAALALLIEDMLNMKDTIVFSRCPERLPSELSGILKFLSVFRMNEVAPGQLSGLDLIGDPAWHGPYTKNEVDRSRWLLTTNLRVPSLNCFSASTSSEDGVFWILASGTTNYCGDERVKGSASCSYFSAFEASKRLRSKAYTTLIACIFASCSYFSAIEASKRLRSKAYTTLIACIFASCSYFSAIEASKRLGSKAYTTLIACIFASCSYFSAFEASKRLRSRAYTTLIACIFASMLKTLKLVCSSSVGDLHEHTTGDAAAFHKGMFAKHACYAYQGACLSRPWVSGVFEISVKECSAVVSLGVTRARDDERGEKRVAPGVTNGRNICDCEHQSSKECDWQAGLLIAPPYLACRGVQIFDTPPRSPLAHPLFLGLGHTKYIQPDGALKLIRPSIESSSLGGKSDEWTVGKTICPAIGRISRDRRTDGRLTDATDGCDSAFNDLRLGGGLAIWSTTVLACSAYVIGFQELFSQRGSGFTFKQLPMEKLRWREYIQYVFLQIARTAAKFLQKSLTFRLATNAKFDLGPSSEITRVGEKQTKLATLSLLIGHCVLQKVHYWRTILARDVGVCGMAGSLFVESGEFWAALNTEVLRCDDTGEVSDIVQHESHMRKTGVDPASKLNPVRQRGRRMLVSLSVKKLAVLDREARKENSGRSGAVHAITQDLDSWEIQGVTYRFKISSFDSLEDTASSLHIHEEIRDTPHESSSIGPIAVATGYASQSSIHSRHYRLLIGCCHQARPSYRTALKDLSHYSSLLITGSQLNKACTHNCSPITVAGDNNKCLNYMTMSTCDKAAGVNSTCLANSILYMQPLHIFFRPSPHSSLFPQACEAHRLKDITGIRKIACIYKRAACVSHAYHIPHRLYESVKSEENWATRNSEFLRADEGESWSLPIVLVQTNGKWACPHHSNLHTNSCLCMLSTVWFGSHFRGNLHEGIVRRRPQEKAMPRGTGESHPSQLTHHNPQFQYSPAAFFSFPLTCFVMLSRPSTASVSHPCDHTSYLSNHWGRGGSEVSLSPRPGRSRIFACGNHAGRCRWSADFLGDLPFTHALSFLHQSSSSALKTSLLTAAQISSLTHLKPRHLHKSVANHQHVPTYIGYNGRFFCGVYPGPLSRSLCAATVVNLRRLFRSTGPRRGYDYEQKERGEEGDETKQRRRVDRCVPDTMSPHHSWTPQSSAYWSHSCVFIGCCSTPGSYGIRKVFPCKSAIGSETYRAGLINCDPMAKQSMAIDEQLLGAYGIEVYRVLIFFREKSLVLTIAHITIELSQEVFELANFSGTRQLVKTFVHSSYSSRKLELETQVLLAKSVTSQGDVFKAGPEYLYRGSLNNSESGEILGVRNQRTMGRRTKAGKPTLEKRDTVAGEGCIVARSIAELFKKLEFQGKLHSGLGVGGVLDPQDLADMACPRSECIYLFVAILSQLRRMTIMSRQVNDPQGLTDTAWQPGVAVWRGVKVGGERESGYKQAGPDLKLSGHSAPSSKLRVQRGYDRGQPGVAVWRGVKVGGERESGYKQAGPDLKLSGHSAPSSTDVYLNSSLSRLHRTSRNLGDNEVMIVGYCNYAPATIAPTFISSATHFVVCACALTRGLNTDDHLVQEQTADMTRFTLSQSPACFLRPARSVYPTHVSQQTIGPKIYTDHKKCSKFPAAIRTMNWPAYSADTNCIENVWSILKRAISNRAHPPMTIQAAKTAAIEEWNYSPQSADLILFGPLDLARSNIVDNVVPGRLDNPAEVTCGSKLRCMVPVPELFNDELQKVRYSSTTFQKLRCEVSSAGHDVSVKPPRGGERCSKPAARLVAAPELQGAIRISCEGAERHSGCLAPSQPRRSSFLADARNVIAEIPEDKDITVIELAEPRRRAQVSTGAFELGSRGRKLNNFENNIINFLGSSAKQDFRRTPQSSFILELSCVFIGCCPTPGSYGIRKVFPCTSAIGSEACRAGQITGDPIAKVTPPFMGLTSVFASNRERTISAMRSGCGFPCNAGAIGESDYRLAPFGKVRVEGGQYPYPSPGCLHRPHRTSGIRTPPPPPPREPRGQHVLPFPVHHTPFRGICDPDFSGLLRIPALRHWLSKLSFTGSLLVESHPGCSSKLWSNRSETPWRMRIKFNLFLNELAKFPACVATCKVCVIVCTKLNFTVLEVSMQQVWNDRPGKTVDPREILPSSSIVWHDSHMRKSGNRTRR
ncbi:hypothetical protein PR048_025656 [Dryococelus australis]|uniref:Uncharacterized protein n=1 Tax=Dryococelus australis TaxID=614101 RepID=A0ABQ9GJ37_9NEOP|nr:hypothetical protein PR048_025656 [Dryococelus australis]